MGSVFMILFHTMFYIYSLVKLMVQKYFEKVYLFGRL